VSLPTATLDAERLKELSRRLGIPARQLLVAAARLAEAKAELASDPAYRERLLQDARNGSADAEAAARLLLTPISDYATNELDRLFASIWPDHQRRQDG
jgi:hypothetical protein